MRVIFFGTPDFAVPTLESLRGSTHRILAVVTAPDKPAGRSLKLTPPPVKRCAVKAGYPVFQPEELREPDFIGGLYRLNADVGVVVAFRILPPEVYNAPKLGCVNLHPSLLPDLRGAAPMQWALMRGYSSTGLTTFRIEKSVDTGGILLQQSAEIRDDDDFGSLSERLAREGAELMLRTLNQMESGSLEAKPQTGASTSAPRIGKADCRIDWTKSAAAIRNHIRGLSPDPGAWTTLNREPLKILRAQAGRSEGVGAPGAVVAVERDRFTVQTGHGGLDVLTVQPAGRRVMASAEFLRGRSLEAGTKFE